MCEYRTKLHWNMFPGVYVAENVFFLSLFLAVLLHLIRKQHTASNKGIFSVKTFECEIRFNFNLFLAANLFIFSFLFFSVLFHHLLPQGWPATVRSQSRHGVGVRLLDWCHTPGEVGRNEVIVPERSSGWPPWPSQETLKANFNVSSEYKDCHADDLGVWTLWHLKSPETPLPVQQFLQVYINENIKAPHDWPFCGGNPPVTFGFPSQRVQQLRKCCHFMTSSLFDSSLVMQGWS